MSQPVYRLWQARPTEAWHQLSEEEQQRSLTLAGEALAAVGGTALVICSAAWANERWPFFGVEKYPDLEAVHRHQELLTDLNWARYMESCTSLGTELVFPE